jgi:hypothetical protein
MSTSPEPDFIAMHENTRDALHSSERPAMAMETMLSMIYEHERWEKVVLAMDTTKAASFMPTRNAFQLQLSILKCLHLQSPKFSLPSLEPLL